MLKYEAVPDKVATPSSPNNCTLSVSPAVNCTMLCEAYCDKDKTGLTTEDGISVPFFITRELITSATVVEMD